MEVINRLHRLDVMKAAQYLLGKQLVRTYRGKILSGTIVETEAYHQNDPASHSYHGQTKRTQVMFGPPGFAYVYFTYGIHWCFNVTAGKEGEGAAVLIRALEPTEGLATMQQLRATTDKLQLTNGPAKLAQALAISQELYGHDLRQPPLQLLDGVSISPGSIAKAKRIGISAGVEEFWRFYVKTSPYVSRK